LDEDEGTVGAVCWEDVLVTAFSEELSASREVGLAESHGAAVGGSGAVLSTDSFGALSLKTLGIGAVESSSRVPKPDGLVRAAELAASVPSCVVRIDNLVE